tara:strand:+ start:2154 stop:2363 length:210 start_codon:yes stop_codon:yes gene_type:complete
MESNYIVYLEQGVVNLQDVEFITWRQNDKTLGWWAKLHLPSGKDVRMVYSNKLEMMAMIELWEEARIGE